MVKKKENTPEIIDTAKIKINIFRDNDPIISFIAAEAPVLVLDIA